MPPPLRVSSHTPNFFSTHTLAGLLTGTNVLMALSYILGALVSVGSLTHTHTHTDPEL